MRSRPLIALTFWLALAETAGAACTTFGTANPPNTPTDATAGADADASGDAQLASDARLLAGGDFETPASACADGWSTYRARVEFDTTQPHGGTADCVLCDGTDASILGATDIYLTSGQALDPARYIAEVWVRLYRGDGAISIIVFHAIGEDGGDTTTNGDDFHTTSSWQKIQFEWAPAPGTKSVRLGLHASIEPGVCVAVDDFTLSTSN